MRLPHYNITTTAANGSNGGIARYTPGSTTERVALHHSDTHHLHATIASRGGLLYVIAAHAPRTPPCLPPSNSNGGAPSTPPPNSTIRATIPLLC